MSNRVFQFCPQCGAKKFIPAGVKNHKCQVCQFEYYFNPCGAVAGIVHDREGRIILTRRAHNPAAGTLDLPGGFIDFHETAEEALQRELYEELNLEVEAMSYFCSMPNLYEYSGFLYHTIDFFFLCNPSNLQKLEANDELSGVIFKKVEEIDLDEIGFDSIKSGLAVLKEKAKRENLCF